MYFTEVPQANPIQVIHVQAALAFVPIAGAVSTGNATFVQPQPVLTPVTEPITRPMTADEVVGHEVIGEEVVGYKVVGYEIKNPSMSTVASR